ncbi:MAG: tetratricopeptide repeat protein, partial [Chitinophagales bacterium]
MVDNSLQIAQEQLQKAIKLAEAAHFQQSIELLERAAFVFREQKEWGYYLQTLNEIGRSYNELDDAEKAMNILNTAFSIAEEQKITNSIYLSFILNTLGRTYSLERELEAELTAYKKALAIASKSHDREQKNALALTYVNLGAYFNEQGGYEKAINFHQKALKNYLESNKECEDDIATCYNNLGGCYCNLGDYAQALPHFQKTLNSWLQSLSPNHPNFIYAYNNIASCYYFKEEFERAIPSFQKALEVVEENFGKNHGLIAAISINVGNCYNRLRQFKKALQFYHQTTEVHKQLYAKNEKQPRAVFENYISLGNCYVEQNQFDKAFDYFGQALKGYQKIFGEKNPKLADVLNRMGYAHLQQGTELEAINSFQESLNSLLPDFQSSDIYQHPKVSGIPFSKPLLFALNRKSLSFYRLYQKSQNRKDLQAAFEGYSTLIQFIDAKRQDFKAYDSKLNLGEQLVGIYEKAIEVAVLMAKNEETSGSISSLQPLQTAFNFAEKSKAVLLLADLKGAEAMSNIPQRMQEEEEGLKRELLELEKKIQEGKSKEHSKEVLQLESEHFEVQQKYQELIDQLERDYPDYHQLKYNTKTVEVEALQSYLRTIEVENVGEEKRERIVLSYYVG